MTDMQLKQVKQNEHYVSPYNLLWQYNYALSLENRSPHLSITLILTAFISIV